MAKFIQCSFCHHLSPAEGSGSCPHCGKLFSFAQERADAPAVHAFASGWYEHIDHEPIYIKNRKQLLHETRSRGQVSLYAED